MRLLIADDEAAVRDALALVLDLNGFEVTTAADGREAMRTLSAQRPDAVILDVLMPGLDGLEVCRRIRATGTPRTSGLRGLLKMKSYHKMPPPGRSHCHMVSANRC